MLRYFAPHCLIRLKKQYTNKNGIPFLSSSYQVPVTVLPSSYQVRIKFEVCKTTVNGQQTFELKIEN